MKTYFDQNRLLKETDRRFHATDVERVGGFIQIVPAVVARLAPQVTIGAWGFTETTLLQAEQIQADRGNDREVHRLREQRWWTRQWRRPNGLYRVRQLDRAENALAERLLGPHGIPPECFPRAEGALVDDNDAQIVAQVIAVGGTLLIRSNRVMIREQMLQEWFDRHHNEWPGVQARKLVQRVDPWFCRWWRHERGPAVCTRSALAAFWPESTEASPRRVRTHAEAGLAAMARGHFPTFAPQVLDYIRRTRDIEDHIETVRRNLPLRTRRAEAERRSMLLARPDIELETASRSHLGQDIGACHWKGDRRGSQAGDDKAFVPRLSNPRPAARHRSRRSSRSDRCHGGR